MKKLFSPVFPHKPILIFATIALFISFTLLSPSIISAQWILCADDKDEICDIDEKGNYTALDDSEDSDWGCVEETSCAFNDDQVGTTRFSSKEECQTALDSIKSDCKNNPWILCADDKDEICDTDENGNYKALDNSKDSDWGCVQKTSCHSNDEQVVTTRFSSQEECENKKQDLLKSTCSSKINDVVLKDGNIDGLIKSMNPIKVCANTPVLACVVNIVVSKIIFPACGILLLIMIIWGGFKMVQGSFTGNQNAIDLGRKRVIGAIYGYLLLAVSFLLWRVVEIVFGFTITG
jgi:hypothetical protein